MDGMDVMDADTRGRYLNAKSWLNMDANVLYVGHWPGMPAPGAFVLEHGRTFIYGTKQFTGEDILARFLDNSIKVIDNTKPLSEGLPDTIMEAIHLRWAGQDLEQGTDTVYPLPGYILLMEKEVMQAKRGWTHNLRGHHSPLAELTEAVAIGLRCIMAYGTSGTTHPSKDEPEGSALLDPGLEETSMLGNTMF